MYCVEWDDDTQLWCVFKEDGEHCYATYSSMEEAEADAERRNEGRS